MVQRAAGLRRLAASVMMGLCLFTGWVTPAAAEGLNPPEAGAMEEQAVLYPDPGAYFKIGSTPYAFTFADCDPDTAGDQACSNPIQAAVDYLSGHNAAPAGGTIYLGAGEYDLTAATPAHVRLDGSQWQTPPAALNLVGMGGTIGGGQATTRLVGRIHINFLHNWGVSDFQMKGVLNASENSGTAVVSGWTNIDTPDTGLIISAQTGNVTLRDVHISHCTGAGAHLGTDGSLEILNSSFSGNNGPGLQVVNAQKVSLHGVSALSNNSHGVILGTFSTNTPVRVTFSNFSRNTFIGLIVDTQGPVYLDRVSSLRNQSGGVWINSYAAATILRSALSFNTGNGLELWTAGKVLLDGLEVVASWGEGAVIHAAKEVVIQDRLGPCLFQNNNVGLSVEEMSAPIRVQGLRAYQNRDTGFAFKGANISLNNVRSVGNLAGGHAIANGSFSAVNVEVSGNTGFGGLQVIQESASTALPVVVQRSTFSGNRGGNGLIMTLQNRATLKDVLAVGNQFTGIFVNNQVTDVFNLPVKLQNIRTLQNGGTGLAVDSSSMITAKGLTSSGNGQNGAYFASRNRLGYPTQSVIVQGRAGENSFENNASSALIVVGRNRGSLSGIRTQGGDSLGIFAEIMDGDVSLQNAAVFGGTGIYLSGRGNMLVKNVQVTDSLNTGLEINSDDIEGESSVVKLSQVSVNRSVNHGVMVYGNQPVTMERVSVVGSQMDGIWLSQNGLVASMPNPAVVLRQVRAEGSGGSGLYFDVKGPLTGDYVQARGSGLTTGEPAAFFRGVGLPFKITCGDFSGNIGLGFRVENGEGLIQFKNVLVGGNKLGDLTYQDWIIELDTNASVQMGACTGW
ncbi:right-handed parallel beta-helix repeat-containing protein [Levilinea saccharolytica]|uniref:Right handed beta helix domain-containing protein n=1 Tax=Levilinea saccharolytica TaxID=229921 RepID=A0A0P6Y9G7_9CHLR|nr:right-handed parallel beta-helix repeat-containing protein [Levilinea saccharolytica]KPL85821.1 hypothetical protein ADN01_05775 [Levilinea saccharolytica]GAP16718.1 right handed beta helix region [Levilinea saccharolytica]